MHARHRGPANGYRSNPMGIGGGGGAGGGPPYRNYNNRTGFGRGHQKIFQSGPLPRPPPPSRRGGDVFMEAGRLATEYLVSKGLLPPNALNGKWQNGNSKNYIGGGDYVPDAVSATGGAMIRFPDDYSYPAGSRDGVRGRRRMGSFKNPGFEWNGEIDPSASSSAKVRGSSDKQVADDAGDDDAFSGSMENLKCGEDGRGGEQQYASGDLESKSCDTGNLETATEKNQNQLPDDNVCLKAPSSDVSPEGGVDSTERSDGSKNPNLGTEEMTMDDNTNGKSEKPTVIEDTPVENSAEENNDNSANKGGNDLLTLIRFQKVPTRTRSSMTIKGPKIDPVLFADDGNNNESHDSGESRGPLLHKSTDVSVGNVPSEERQELNPESNVQEAPSAEEVEQFDHEYKCEGQLEYNRCNSVVLGRGEKRPLCLIDGGEGAKKPRDEAPSNAQADEGFHPSTSRGDQQSSQEERSSVEEVITEPSHDYAKRKQPFSGSFKICDLNFMEVSEVKENRDSNSAVTFQPIGESKQEAVSVDLSMSSSSNISDRHSSRRSDDKEVEVIDLESDSVKDHKALNNSERMDEAIFTDLESFPDSMQRVNEMPQDGYGLMISEFLEADIPNCSGAGVNPIHDEIGLRSDEGILDDDESIYMSLGEIPISFVPVWDQQPTRGYDKPY